MLLQTPDQIPFGAECPTTRPSSLCKVRLVGNESQDYEWYPLGLIWLKLESNVHVGQSHYEYSPPGQTVDSISPCQLTIMLPFC